MPQILVAFKHVISKMELLLDSYVWNGVLLMDVFVLMEQCSMKKELSV